MAKPRKTGRNPLGPLYPARRAVRLTEAWQGFQQAHEAQEGRGFVRDPTAQGRRVTASHHEGGKVGDGRSD